MEGRTLVTVVLVLVIAGGLWWYFAGDSLPLAPQTENTTGTSTTTDSTTGTVPTGSEGGDATSTGPANAITITYTTQGYSPANATVPVGGAVTFVNQSSVDMWPAVDEHPTHTQYDTTARAEHCAASYTGPSPFDACKRIPAGESWSFTFIKAGTWEYHDHTDAAKRGTIVVGGTSASAGVNVNVQ